MDQKQLLSIIEKQDNFFLTGKTKDLLFREEMLKKLQRAVIQREKDIMAAIKKDIYKPETESFITEIALVLSEIEYFFKNLKKWTKPLRISLPLGFFPGKGYLINEPYGRVLIIGPWNFPFQLIMYPLAGAIAAGNCVLIKPSELAPHTSGIIAEIIGCTFDPQYIAVAEGDTETGKILLAAQWDHIFFTGGMSIGKIILKAAAEHLTPVTLELGGKCPCIVDSGINLEVAARRIAWGKFINAGQVCLSPDYVYIKKALKAKFLECIKNCIETFFTKDARQSPDYSRIINEKHFDRIMHLIDMHKIYYGGTNDKATLFIAPTLLDNVSWNDPVMQEEIFGPVLPVMEYESIDEVTCALGRQAAPLALYLFSNNNQLIKQIIKHTSSGSVCINDVVMQIMPRQLPFGGIGASGMGKYHGKYSIETFSHKRGILQRSFCLDAPQRYPPYKTPIKVLKTIMKFMT